MKKLESGEINIGIIQESNASDDIVTIPILVDKLVLVVGYSQPIKSINIDHN